MLRGLPEPPRDRGGSGTLRAALNYAIGEELISRNVAELIKLPKTRKKLKRRNSWTVDEARKFLEWSRNENDQLYPLWVLILVLGLRKGEALGLIERSRHTDEDTAVIDLAWQLQRVGGHPLTHKQVLKADGSTDTLPLPPICVTALRIANRNQDAARAATTGRGDVHLRGKTPGRVHHPERAPDRAAEYQPCL